ncbi:MAG: ABC transporter permease [Cyanobacteria bacterium NC_groundwater_1444_Ag_S-0.65um_54_12]|nr:ABC transporter permease [Cyanobacteria bacterium NC_groundwater_1444_Ag_S-0.65um_54_12]
MMTIKHDTLLLVSRAMQSRRIRFWWACGGIALCVLLTLVLLAANRSLEASIRAYIGQGSADLWLAPRGTDNLIRSSSFLPRAALTTARQTSGVAMADPILRSFVTAMTDRPSDQGAGKTLTLLGIGYRTPNGLGKPTRLIAGRMPNAWREVTLDRAAAYRLGVGPGQHIRLNGLPVRVAGITVDTNLLATQFLFGDEQAAAAYSNIPGLISFIAIKLQPGSLPAALTRRLTSRLPQTVVYTRSEFTANNLREVSAGFKPLLILLLAVGMGVAAVLVGLLLQGVIEDRRSAIAVLLALGTSAIAIAAGIVRQALILTVGGTMLGAMLAGGIFFLLDQLVPTLALVSLTQDVVKVFGLFSLVGTVTALCFTWRIRNVDPFEAFRP